MQWVNIRLFWFVCNIRPHKKNSWLASLGFGKKWAGGQKLGDIFLYISKYDSYRHFHMQFLNLLTQLTTVNRNTTHIIARWSIKKFLIKKKNPERDLFCWRARMLTNYFLMWPYDWHLAPPHSKGYFMRISMVVFILKGGGG